MMTKKVGGGFSYAAQYEPGCELEALCSAGINAYNFTGAGGLAWPP